MPRLIAALLLLAPLTCSAEVIFDWAHVGNAGNAPDPETGYGSVAYDYAISKHEVTNAQYTAFLNAVDPTGSNALALYSTDMAGDFGGIELQGSHTDGSKFVTQPGREQNPVTYVSFFDAMRFTNWLHNGQGSGDTETGAYTIGSGVDEVRLPGAKFWIPSEDEWYKAAYHNASAGTAGVYFDYATSSDSVPVSDQPWDNPAAVNFLAGDRGVPTGSNDGYAVSGSIDIGPNPFTDVGAYTSAVSPYGTWDQNGNVSEWNEGDISFRNPDDGWPFRGFRGGAWSYGWPQLRTSYRDGNRPSLSRNYLGFRVATVPEPTTLTATLVAAAFVGVRPRRRRYAKQSHAMG